LHGLEKISDESAIEVVIVEAGHAK
jgi:hypothetical protein